MSQDPLAERIAQGLRPLPPRAEALLRQLYAPSRLVAHLLLVHDVAIQLLDGLRSLGIAAGIHEEAVLFGVATHDIGKIHHPFELTGPGKQHESAGRELLLSAGITPALACFAETHGQPLETPGLTIDDYLVKLADSCWKGVRDQLLEEQIIADRVQRAEISCWEIFMSIDELIEDITACADRRLAWQAMFTAL